MPVAPRDHVAGFVMFAVPALGLIAYLNACAVHTFWRSEARWSNDSVGGYVEAILSIGPGLGGWTFVISMLGLLCMVIGAITREPIAFLLFAVLWTVSTIPGVLYGLLVFFIAMPTFELFFGRWGAVLMWLFELGLLWGTPWLASIWILFAPDEPPRSSSGESSGFG